MLRSANAILVLSVLAACHSPGTYGYAVSYAPTADEETAVKGAREYDPVMAQRDPASWRTATTTLFGVVTVRAAGAGGAASLTLGVRRLEPRNLCANANDEDTCRVTVSDHDFGVVHVQAKLLPDDDLGGKSIRAGSLVRVAGQIGEDVDPNDGAPILRARFYRHWPRSTFVTRANADTMRQ